MPGWLSTSPGAIALALIPSGPSDRAMADRGAHEGELAHPVQATGHERAGGHLVDDATAAPFDHPRLHGGDAVQGAEHVHPHHSIEPLVRDVEHVDLRDLGHQRGIVHEDVDPAERLGDVRGHRRRRLPVGDVDLHGGRRAPPATSAAAARSAASPFRSARATSAPASPSARPYTWPMAPPPPVTIATLPSNRNRSIALTTSPF